MSDLFFLNNSDWNGKYELIECKRALSPSGLPDIDFALNPYSGCEHGCIYCYAPEVTHAEWREWRVVKVKTNVVQRLGKELKYAEGVVGIGTVTDPYQGAESKYRLTRGCLEILKRNDRKIHLHTKSDLILRDIDLLSEMDCLVAVTITGIDEKYSKITEPGAPMPSARLNALSEIVDAGIDAYALVGPVLSHIQGREKEFVNAIAETGVKLMYIDRLNVRLLLNERLIRKGLRGCTDSCIEEIKTLSSDAGIKVKDVFQHNNG